MMRHINIVVPPPFLCFLGKALSMVRVSTKADEAEFDNYQHQYPILQLEKNNSRLTTRPFSTWRTRPSEHMLTGASTDLKLGLGAGSLTKPKRMNTYSPLNPRLSREERRVSGEQWN
jgi:hypothetical protein